MNITMKLILAAVALFVATPSVAADLSLPPTKAQLKDIDKLAGAYWRCRDYVVEPFTDPAYEPDNREAKKACDLRDRLANKLERQGFCLYKSYNVGRPGKNRGDCNDLPDH
jgi:hypothetical protein